MKTKQFTPMLAHTATKIDYNNNEVFIQPKLDGIRCYITKDGAFSRNHKRFYNCEHIIRDLKPIFNENPDIILDGEIYNHKLKNDFGKIISVARKKTPDAEAVVYLQYHIYDMFDPNSPDLLYSSRYTVIKSLTNIFYSPYIDVSKTLVITNDDRLSIYHQMFLEEGYEGSIVRYNAPYECKRSKNLIKVKDWKDTEFTITDYVEGKGKFAGGIGKFLGFDENDRDIEVPIPNITIEERREIFNNIGDYIGKKATFIYFERTPSGAYRFPKFKALRNYE